MKNSLIYKFLLAFLTLILINTGVAQTTPVLSVPLIISDQVDPELTLYFGLDTRASDTTDVLLGEANLPPFPPAGVFEARFAFPYDDYSGVVASYKDFRKASSFPYTGSKEHRLKFQPGSGTTVKIFWDLPQGITGRLNDVITGALIDVPMTATGSYIVTDPLAFDQLKFTVTYTAVTSLNESSILPGSFVLSQNFPNPFNPSTTIAFNLSESSVINLEIYNLLGKKVMTVASGFYRSGDHSVSLNASGLESGIYYYTLRQGTKQVTKKMVLVK